jgi:hypothetical protein
MSKIKIMKDEIFDEVRKNYELRQEIADVEFVQNNSVRTLAIAKSDKLTRYNVIVVIKRFLKLKTLDEMFITREKR